MSVSLRDMRMVGISVAVAATLLAGCGGGGDDLSSLVGGAPTSIDSRPSADASQLGSVSSRCGQSSFEDFGATTINSGSFLATFGGFSQVVGYLASADYFDTSVRMDIAIPQTDFRMGSLDLGHDVNRMGVAMNGPFLVGALACVKGLARVNVVEGQTEVQWFSDALPQLPVNSLPGVPVAGIELFGNFEPGNPTIYFTLDASVVPRPDDMSLCKLGAGNAWECVPAINRLDGMSHVLSSSVHGEGRYLLVELPQIAD